MTPTVVMRSHNDMPLIAGTLSRLHEQRHPFVLIVFDNASTDGTPDEVRQYTDRVIHVPAGAYVPGKVLNEAMAGAAGEYVVFLNADCTPQHPEWLERLLDGFGDDRVAAVFGRQIPRPDCYPLYAKDTEATYGDGSRHKFWRHCFSMAASAIRASVWRAMPFDERLQYSEDIDWTWRARQQGHRIVYAADAIVMHSHNYSLRQLYRRQYGEGMAEASIFDWTPWQAGLLRYSLLPYGRQVASDWRYGLEHGTPGAIGFSPILRMAHLLGRRKGFRDGWRERQRRHEESGPP